MDKKIRATSRPRNAQANPGQNVKVSIPTSTSLSGKGNQKQAELSTKVQRDLKSNTQTAFLNSISPNISAQMKTFNQDKKQVLESNNQMIGNQTANYAFSLHNNSNKTKFPIETVYSPKNFLGVGDDDLNKEQISQEKNLKSPSEILNLIKRRLDALKLLQMKNAMLEAKFYEDLYLLECKYNKICKPLKDLRKKIIMGEHEPHDDECKLISIRNNGDQSSGNVNLSDDLDREREISKELLAMTISNYSTKKGEFVKGIPEFWLSVLKRVGLISQMIEPYDEPILKYLYDIDIEFQDKKPYNFTLKFYFWPNEYFTDSTLTKTYEFKIELDSTDPYVFEAPETECSKGCKINWKKGKNITRKTTFLTEQNNNISQQYDFQDRQPSFFNFFDTIDIENKNQHSLTSDEEAELAIDYEIGYTFKEKVIPRAILYYLGEITDDNDQSDFGEYEDENDEDDECEQRFNQLKTESSMDDKIRNLNKN